MTQDELYNEQMKKLENAIEKSKNDPVFAKDLLTKAGIILPNGEIAPPYKPE